MDSILDIPSTYFVHAPEIRRVARRKKETFTFTETHSWLDVGLQTLKRAGWWPECSQPQITHTERMIPPDEFESHLSVFRTYTATERIVEHRGTKVPTSLVEIISGVIRIDNIIATLVVIMANGRVLRGEGIIHGQATTESLPEYAQEVSVLHALRAFRTWMHGMEQTLIQKVNVRAGTATICCHIDNWMKGGICNLSSVAASGILGEIQQLPTWLRVDSSLCPFYMPDNTEEEGYLPWTMSLYIGLLEHFRTIVLPQQPRDWTAKLPRTPLTTEELKRELNEVYEKDELAVMKQLSEIGSVSASIVLSLQLTRAAIKEAYQALRDSPEEQQNLTEILSATRFKTYHKGRVYHIKCPKKTCFTRDPFGHMLYCYSLRSELKK